MITQHKRALMWGAVFGFLAPFIGMFVGLQISPIVADVLMFPIVGLAAVLGSPFGMWGMGLKLASLVLSIVAWAVVFMLISKLIKR